MTTAWPGEYGPKVVIWRRSSNSRRSSAWNASAAVRATVWSAAIVALLLDDLARGVESLDAREPGLGGERGGGFHARVEVGRLGHRPGRGHVSHPLVPYSLA